MGRIAFVTGATGFVGRHLVDHLTSESWRVRALVRASSDTRYLEARGIELVRGGLDSSAALVDGVSGADTVFHLAAVTAARTAAEYERANAAGTGAVVEAIRAAPARPRRLVYLSSYAATGPATGGIPRPLAATPEPLTAYGRTKLRGERLASEAVRDGTEVVVLRAPAVYGPGDRALLPYFRLIRWRIAPLPGGGEGRLHLIYGPDLALALGNAPDSATGTFAVADPNVYSWNDVVTTIAGVLDRRPIRIPLPPPLVRNAAAVTEAIGRFAGRAVPFNREKADEMLAADWRSDLSGSTAFLPPPRVTQLSDGIERTIRWYFRQGWL
jgi:dihydroflavonol-4-reductase